MDKHTTDIISYIQPYLPPSLNFSAADTISLDDATTIAIHLASLRQGIATYLPHYLVAQIARQPQPGQVRGEFRYGAVMFADVSGFTAMSEKLSALGKEGAEEITGIVNAYFDAMLAISDEYGGDLLKFGGDALLLFFEGDDGAHRAVTTAWVMQQAMEKFARVKTSQGIFPLRMSIGIGSGHVFLASLGTPENMEYAVMGQALTNMAQAEHVASAGQIVVDSVTRDVVNRFATFSPAEDFWLMNELHAPTEPLKTQAASSPAKMPDLLDATVDSLLAFADRQRRIIAGMEPFIPRQLLEQLIINPQDPLLPGSHRPVTVMFANFYGIDNIIETLGEAHQDTITQILNDHFVTMSRIISQFGGVVNKVDAYAIGHRIMALFGALQAHEDDPQRAVRAALAMNAALADVNRRAAETLAKIYPSGEKFGDTPLKQRIGLNSGFVFAGNVGSATRHEYSVMGDEVNLTARLMGVAQEGEVLISWSTARRVETAFDLREKDPVPVKGKSQPVRNFVVLAERQQPSRWQNLSGAPMVGRNDELQTGLTAIEQVFRGRGAILVISGVSGIGKTRFAEELAYRAEQRGMDLLAGICLSYGKTMTYHPWADILRSHFGITQNDDISARVAAVERGMAAIGETVWLPVIADVLGLDVPDNDLTRAIDAKLRRQRIMDLTVKLLQARAAHKPLMVVVEDAHWADPASMELINYVARNIAEHPIMLVLPHRTDPDLPDWTAYPHAINLPLADLPDEACLEIVQGMIGKVELPTELQQLILSKGGGNPFFIEEVVRVLIDNQVIKKMPGGEWKLAGNLAGIELPDTIHGIIISRIDRLLEIDRRILRVASVVGRIFAYRVVSSVQNYGSAEPVVREHLDYLQDLGLTELFQIESLLYRFKHLTTREVVYESLSFEQRRTLHRRIADFYERVFADSLGEQIDLLAYHYFEGHAWMKAIEYNLRAARHAQREFANATAVAAYRKVLESAANIEDADTTAARLEAHESLGDVLTLMGQYDDALEHLAIAREMVAETDTPRLADVSRKIAAVHERRSEFDSAFEWLRRGLSHLPDDTPTIEAARIYLLGAGVFQRQGKNDDAIRWCERGLEIATKFGTFESRQLVGNAYYLLGLIYTRKGELNRAAAFCKSSIGVYEPIADEVGLSHAYNNLGNVYSDLGDWEQATAMLEKALAGKKRIGDVLYQGFITNNLANIQMNRGNWDDAERLFLQSLDVWKQLGASLPHAVTASNLGQLRLYQRNFPEAKHLLATSEEIFTSIESEDFLPELERRWAELYLHTGNIDTALNHIHRSLKLAVQQEAKLEEGMSCRVLGLVQMAQKQQKPAEISLRRSLKILTDLNSTYEIAKTNVAFGQLWQNEKPTAARQKLNDAISTFKALGAKPDLQYAESLITHLP